MRKRMIQAAGGVMMLFLGLAFIPVSGAETEPEYKLNPQVEALIRDYLKQTPRYDIFVLTTVDRDYYRKKGFLLAPGSAIEEENVFCYNLGKKKVFLYNDFSSLSVYTYDIDSILQDKKKYKVKYPRGKEIHYIPTPSSMHVFRGVYFEYDPQTREVGNISYRPDTLHIGLYGRKITEIEIKVK